MADWWYSSIHCCVILFGLCLLDQNLYIALLAATHGLQLFIDVSWYAAQSLYHTHIAGKTRDVKSTRGKNTHKEKSWEVVLSEVLVSVFLFLLHVYLFSWWWYQFLLWFSIFNCNFNHQLQYDPDTDWKWRESLFYGIEIPYFSCFLSLSLPLSLVEILDKSHLILLLLPFLFFLHFILFYFFMFSRLFFFLSCLLCCLPFGTIIVSVSGCPLQIGC